MIRDKTKDVLITICTILIALQPGQSLAFSEDLCVKPINHFGAPLENCLQADFCSPDSNAPSDWCRANVMIDAGLATITGTGTARSMIHVDATHMIAQAIGFDPVGAYWIAAYNQVTDVEAYVPFGMFGQPVRTLPNGMPTVPITMNGWGRAAPTTGGFLYHFVPPFQGQGEALIIDCSSNPVAGSVCGIWPDLEDLDHEGPLIGMREWAFGERDMPCANSFTEQGNDGSYFSGRNCYMEDPLLPTTPEQVLKHVTGMMPIISGLDPYGPFTSYTGNQIAQYLPGTVSFPYPTELVYADELGLETLFKAAYGGMDVGLITAGRDVQAYLALLRLGLYLHSVQDRISHHQCGDLSPIVGPDEEQNFVVLYDQLECSQDYHAWRHFEELGLSPLPERTLSALEYTFNELEQFAYRYPQWLTADAPILTMSDADYASHRTAILQTVVDALEAEDACLRLKRMIYNLHELGYEQLPGNDVKDINGMCTGLPSGG